MNCALLFTGNWQPGSGNIRSKGNSQTLQTFGVSLNQEKFPKDLVGVSEPHERQVLSCR
jgi:hypothetical protein